MDHLGMYESFYQNDDAVHYGDVMYDDSDADPELEEIVVDTGHGFDFLPAHAELGKYQTWIDDDPYGIFCFKNNIVDPLLGETYDYIVLDSTNSQGTLFQDAVMTAAPNLVIPLLSGPGSEGGLHRLLTGPVKKLREHRDVNVVSVMPNRFDGNNDEERLLERLNENYPQYVPPFAEEEMLETSPGPGTRKTKPIDRAWREGTVLSEYDPENVNNERFAQLADVIVNGGTDDE